MTLHLSVSRPTYFPLTICLAYVTDTHHFSRLNLTNKRKQKPDILTKFKFKIQSIKIQIISNWNTFDYYFTTKMNLLDKFLHLSLLD